MCQLALRANANRVLRKDCSEVYAVFRRADDELIIRLSVLLEDNHNRGKGGVTIIVEARGSRRHHDRGNDSGLRFFGLRQFLSVWGDYAKKSEINSCGG